MRIYDGDHSLNRILEDCRVGTRGDPPAGGTLGINLARLNEHLRTIDVHEIRRRREKLECFFQEIMVSASADRGINFTSCLMILAHYNVIEDNKSLRLEEYLRRRARLQRVEEEVRRRVVRGFFDTMFWSRRFRKRLDSRSSARLITIPQFAVPEIFIEDQDPDSPPIGDIPLSPASDISPMDITRASLDVGGLRRRGDSRTGSPPASIIQSASASPRSPHRPSPSEGSTSFQWDHDGAEENGMGGRSRAGSSAVDRQNVLEVFDNSAWGESIRRSFTLRRSGTRGRGGGGHEGR